MSYILDALRRAQADRERGQIPGLNSQQGLPGRQPMALGGAQTDRRPTPGWLWALGGGLVVLIAVLFWWVQRPGAAPVAATPPLAVASGTAPSPVAVAAATPGAGLVVVSAPITALAPAPAPALAPVTVPVPVPTGAQRSAGVVAGSVNRAAGAAPAAPALPLAAAPSPVSNSPAASNAVASAGAPPQQGTSTAPAAPVAAPVSLPPALTAEQRREWPALNLNGSVWSDTPSARFVILGGQLMHEGQSTPEGIVVERITPRAVVLRWKDQRASLGL